MTTKLSDVRMSVGDEHVPALSEDSNVTQPPSDEARAVVAAVRERVSLAHEYQDMAEEMLVIARETKVVQRRVIIEE